MSTNKEWLVEIRLKDWKADLPGGKRIVTYEAVLADDELSARYAGFYQFENKCHYEPVSRRRMKVLGLVTNDCCAPDAVQIS